MKSRAYYLERAIPSATNQGFLLSINSRDRVNSLNKNDRWLNKSGVFVTKVVNYIRNLSDFLTGYCAALSIFFQIRLLGIVESHRC